MYGGGYASSNVKLLQAVASGRQQAVAAVHHQQWINKTSQGGGVIQQSHQLGNASIGELLTQHGSGACSAVSGIQGGALSSGSFCGPIPSGQLSPGNSSLVQLMDADGKIYYYNPDA